MSWICNAHGGTVPDDRLFLFFHSSESSVLKVFAYGHFPLIT